MHMVTIHGRALALTGLALLGLAKAAWADEFWPENEHYYRIVWTPGIRWSSAQAAAMAAGGYLATCTSGNENEFVFSLLADPSWWIKSDSAYFGPWLGGWQGDETQGPDKDWVWSTGEPWSFTAWAAGQPDDARGRSENALHYFYTEPEGPSPTWNDLPGIGPSDQQQYLSSFVVEFDTQPVVRRWMKSTFQAGTEGWATCGDAKPIEWQAPTQTARGCVYLTDLQDGRSGLFVAPAAYLGNKEGTYGGALSFELRAAEGVNLHPRWDIRLHGAGKGLFFDLPDPQSGAWTLRLARLTTGAGWRVGSPDGPTATEADLRSVLADLKAIVINGEFHYGSDKTLIDDVVLSIRQDFDRDGDVDGDDYADLEACRSGPAVAHNQTGVCRQADLDDDGDVDQNDFGQFQRCYTGKDRSSEPACNLERKRPQAI
jgi:hypothetical protein